MLLSIIKNANLALSFFLELGVLVALGYWGFQMGPNLPVKIMFGIGAPVLAIVVWAIFGARTSQWRLHDPWFLLLKIVFFGSAAVALFVAGQRVGGVTFALIFVLNTILAYVFEQ